MKTLLITASETETENCAQYLESIGSENITYRWPVKAMDNISEIAPHLVVINADDFPRLWKTFVQFMRADPTFDHAIIFLVSGHDLSEKEQEKAQTLGIKKVLPRKLSETDKRTIYNMLVQGNLVSEKTSMQFAFRHPADYRIITGRIMSMFSSIIIFKPEKRYLIDNIKPGTVIKSCTLKIGHTTTEPPVKVLSNNGLELELQIL